MAAVFNRYRSTSLRMGKYGETMQIIIVEDEENIRKELKQLLQNAMYEVTTIELLTWQGRSRGLFADAGSGFAGSESSGGVRICHLYEDPGVLGDSCDLSDQPNRFDG